MHTHKYLLIYPIMFKSLSGFAISFLFQFDIFLHWKCCSRRFQWMHALHMANSDFSIVSSLWSKLNYIVECKFPTTTLSMQMMRVFMLLLVIAQCKLHTKIQCTLMRFNLSALQMDVLVYGMYSQCGQMSNEKCNSVLVLLAAHTQVLTSSHKQRMNHLPLRICVQISAFSSQFHSDVNYSFTRKTFTSQFQPPSPSATSTMLFIFRVHLQPKSHPIHHCTKLDKAAVESPCPFHRIVAFTSP